jgi:hypothetical protein
MNKNQNGQNMQRNAIAHAHEIIFVAKVTPGISETG